MFFFELLAIQLKTNKYIFNTKSRIEKYKFNAYLCFLYVHTFGMINVVKMNYRHFNPVNAIFLQTIVYAKYRHEKRGEK